MSRFRDALIHEPKNLIVNGGVYYKSLADVMANNPLTSYQVAEHFLTYIFAELKEEYPKQEWRCEVVQELGLKIEWAPEGAEYRKKVLKFVADPWQMRPPHAGAMLVTLVQKAEHVWKNSVFDRWWAAHKQEYTLGDFIAWNYNHWFKYGPKYTCAVEFDPRAPQDECVLEKTGESAWKITLSWYHHLPLSRELDRIAEKKTSEGYFPWAVAERNVIIGGFE